jgi:hypothetical protein
MLLAALSALCLSAASAQITITDHTFPSAGDTLKFATDNNPQGIDVMTSPGVTNFLWDFSSLKVGQTSQTTYRPTSAGANAASFPGADMVLIGQAGESYYNKTTTKFEFMGYAGADPIGFGLNVLAKYSPVLVERKAPLKYLDASQQTTNFSLPFPAAPILALLPDSIVSGFPVLPDSFRVRSQIARSEQVDGWGNCKIPGGTYPVLRLRRTDLTTNKLDAFIKPLPFLPGTWVDITTLAGGSGGGGFGNLLGTDTTITFRFLSGTGKEEIAVATMTNDLSEVETVRFRNTTGISAAPDLLAPGTANIQAYPNPAVEWVRFDCTNLAPGDYTLKIFNVIGKTVWKEVYPINSSRSIRIELDDFRKGTYLYSLADSKGNIIGTKRLVVLKP